MVDEITEVEEWRPIKGMESQYEISNLGRVKVIDSGYIVKPGRWGKTKYYPMIQLVGPDSRQVFMVHRLIAETFLPKPSSPGRLIVRFKDGDKQNARLDNLKWVVQKQHKSASQRYVRKGRPRARLTEAMVIEMRRLNKEGHSKTSLAARFSVATATVYAIVKGKTWKHVTDESAAPTTEAAEPT